MFARSKSKSVGVGAFGTVAVLAVLILSGCSRAQFFPQPEVAFAAVRDNDTEALQQFLDGGLDVNKISRLGTSLIYVAIGPKGGHEVLEMLIANGADVSRGNKKGRTPLMNAAGWCDGLAITMLLEAGADVAFIAKSGKSASDEVCVSPPELRRQALNLLFGR